jgi:hypothetical protein
MAGEDQNVGARSHYLLDDPLATDLALKNLDEVFPQWRDRDNRSVNLTDAPQQDRDPGPKTTLRSWPGCPPRRRSHGYRPCPSYTN